MKDKKKTELQIAQDEVQATINKTNKSIEQVGINSGNLYESLTSIQEIFDRIRNVPNDKKLQYEELKEIRLHWKQQVDKIENDYQTASVKNAGVGAAGAGLGVAVVAMGPTVAMGIATTFGVASTGTAISALSGAAATNAALAWLGGGALAAGGGGMAAGNALLAMAGPIGWAIAISASLASLFLFWQNSRNKKCLEKIFVSISHRDIKSYELAIVELKERIRRIIDENDKLNEAIERIQTFGLDYNAMTEAQQYELGAYVNLMLSSTQLLVNPTNGLLPKYSEDDFNSYELWMERKSKMGLCQDNRNLIISLANLLYKIELDDKEKKLLWKSFRENDKLLETMGILKKDFDMDIMNAVFEALDYKYSCLERRPQHMITVTNLSYSYDGKTNVLEDVNFSVEEGNLMIIKGNINKDNSET